MGWSEWQDLGGKGFALFELKVTRSATDKIIPMVESSNLSVTDNVITFTKSGNYKVYFYGCRNTASQTLNIKYNLNGTTTTVNGTSSYTLLFSSSTMSFSAGDTLYFTLTDTYGFGSVAVVEIE